MKSVLALVFLPELNSVGIDAPGISPGDLLITSSADYTVKTWSLKTAKTIQVSLKTHQKINPVRLS